MTIQTVDEKIDNAVHAAFMAMGLSVETCSDFADSLNDFLTQEAPAYITDDSEERDEE